LKLLSRAFRRFFSSYEQSSISDVNIFHLSFFPLFWLIKPSINHYPEYYSKKGCKVEKVLASCYKLNDD